MGAVAVALNVLVPGSPGAVTSESWVTQVTVTVTEPPATKLVTSVETAGEGHATWSDASVAATAAAADDCAAAALPWTTAASAPARAAALDVTLSRFDPSEEDHEESHQQQQGRDDDQFGQGLAGLV